MIYNIPHTIPYTIYHTGICIYRNKIYYIFIDIIYYIYISYTIYLSLYVYIPYTLYIYNMVHTIYPKCGPFGSNLPRPPPSRQARPGRRPRRRATRPEASGGRRPGPGPKGHVQDIWSILHYIIYVYIIYIYIRYIYIFYSIYYM